MLQLMLFYLTTLGMVSAIWESAEVVIHGSSQPSVVDAVIAMYLALRITIAAFDRME